ncbi:hypothetical protein Pcinc_018905 [Petrolisthes cinctipes]|uniref:Uncharacterized protein n=1 Tax=Petrolisthes cinctipes TaxID=88211 RepID=A0AAE1FL89_PETCI|nr:hypothetical protein Pcinc_018905 [Petrolisthes cinctipes]
MWPGQPTTVLGLDSPPSNNAIANQVTSALTLTLTSIPHHLTFPSALVLKSFSIPSHPYLPILSLCIASLQYHPLRPHNFPYFSSTLTSPYSNLPFPRYPFRHMPEPDPTSSPYSPLSIPNTLPYSTLLSYPSLPRHPIPPFPPTPPHLVTLFHPSLQPLPTSSPYSTLLSYPTPPRYPIPPISPTPPHLVTRFHPSLLPLPHMPTPLPSPRLYP